MNQQPQPSMPDLAVICTDGTIKVEGDLIYIARGCAPLRIHLTPAWQSKFSQITGIVETGRKGQMIQVHIQVPGGGFHTGIPRLELEKLLTFHRERILQ